MVPAGVVVWALEANGVPLQRLRRRAAGSEAGRCGKGQAH